ncbi:hydrogen gas-evolving membrane-bound hydrogenase subunit E [Legionella clemsonensis]|uniref:Na(+)/H(+) antiporter subunit A n=1 Tax=Legionella clemsonensis TaxID=1867846 RepID=A0A222P1N8_9GAMM|nr:hydrogen gas-evolving membrane-bound hydrogenase subunit E [Legionella clemsonensis]ASQ45747.1 Na(+)/H(+) antiporter subunit A [Legionella clemsonensis]
MIGIIALIFLMSLLSPFIIRMFSFRGAWVLPLPPLAGFLYFLYCTYWTTELPVTLSIPWFDAFGVALTFYLDGLSLLFAYLITGIGSIVVFYSVTYLRNHPLFNRFYAYLFLFMGSMLGLVLASNLITLFIFWELTSVSSYLLIGFDNKRQAAREAALNALLVTSAGGLALLTGFLLIGSVTHTFELTELLQHPAILRQNSLYGWILVLILIGAFTKSAQFPFHFWLPGAMKAPTPVSAYLHSATMVQAGVYLLARFYTLLSGTPLWFGFLTAFGGITMIGGLLLALREKDIKLVLAYTTVSALGSLIYMLASDQEEVIIACVAFIFAHALYKASLFLAAGNIQYQTGTRQLSRMHGLLHAMPATYATVLIAASSMAGLPPLLGFYVKELIYEAEQVIPFFSQILITIVILTNMGLVMLACVFVIKPALGRKPRKNSSESYFSMWFSGLTLALMTLFFSVFPSFIDQSLLAPAASSILHHPIHLKLELWHGVTPSFVLSLITLLGGFLLYLQRSKVLKWIGYFKFMVYYGPEFAYSRIINFILWFSNYQTRLIQNGRLTIYLMITLLTVAIILGSALMSTRINFSLAIISVPWFSVFLLFWVLVSAIAVAVATQLIIAVIFLGAFGMGVALFFLVNAAPDVAMTQVLVETLFVIIFALTLYKSQKIPSLETQTESQLFKILRLGIAISMGLIFTILLMAVISSPINNKLNQYFINNSVTLGHGRNIVNVILIDFRALDTMGEVIVLVIAALGIHGLLKRKLLGIWL